MTSHAGLKSRQSTSGKTRGRSASASGTYQSDGRTDWKTSGMTSQSHQWSTNLHETSRHLTADGSCPPAVCLSARVELNTAVYLSYNGPPARLGSKVRVFGQQQNHHTEIRSRSTDRPSVDGYANINLKYPIPSHYHRFTAVCRVNLA